MVTRQSGYYGPKLWATRGTTQWGMDSTALLNVVVGSLIRYWLLLMVEEGELIRDGLGYAVGRSLGVLYSDDGLLESRYPEWIQGALNFLI